MRRQLALALQAMFATVGAKVTVTAVDFPVFQERLHQRRFDAYIGAWLDDPSPRGLTDQWTRAGWDALNYGHYANPAFDTLFARAGRLPDAAAARAAYREAMDTLNADAPAVFLYTPTNAAAVSRRLSGVRDRPVLLARARCRTGESARAESSRAGPVAGPLWRGLPRLAVQGSAGRCQDQVTRKVDADLQAR